MSINHRGASARGALAWVAPGGILLFAVGGHPAFINLQEIGLILIARGLISLWLSTSRKRLARSVDRLATAVARGIRTVDALATDPAREQSTRVPLTDLLGPTKGHDNDE